MTFTPDRIAALKQRAADSLDDYGAALASAAQEAALAAFLVSTPDEDLIRGSLEARLRSPADLLDQGTSDQSGESPVTLSHSRR